MNEGQGGGVYDGRAARARYMAACPDTTFAPPHTHTHGLNDLGECMVELTCAVSAWATCIARCTVLPVRVNLPTLSHATDRPAQCSQHSVCPCTGGAQRCSTTSIHDAMASR